MQVSSTINSIDARYADYRNEPTSGLRVLQNSLLTELPGAMFALLTLVYIVSALVRL